MSETKRDYSLDFLKALAITLVVIWHTKPFRFFSSDMSFASLLVSYMLGAFYSQITLLAVPLFYIVSILLFYSKANKDIIYFKHRLMRVFTIYIFWTVIQFIMYFSLSSLLPPRLVPDINWALSLFQGGPDLPIAGGSIFYFLSNMLLLTCFAFCYGWKGNERLWTAISYIFIIMHIVYFEIINFRGTSIPYWRIDNFIIYVPVVYLLFNNPNVIRYKYIYFMLFILSSLHELFITKLNFFSFLYGRTSILFGAISLFCFFYKKTLKEKKYVAFLSEYSLGIFALHLYWWLVIVIIAIFGLNLNPYDPIVPDVVLTQCYFITGFVTFVLTLISVYLLGLTPLRRFVK
jgi:hypothetical protein